MEVARRLRDEVGKLTRQHAARVAVAYAVVAWLVLQVASVVVPALGLPGWAMTFIIALIALGFPVAVVLAWAQHRPAEKERQPSELAVAVAVPSIAVLSFSDLSAAKDQDFFCDGIAEELLNALGGISGLQVAARSSSFQFRGRAVDTREIARTLGVTTLLEGSVRKAGERVRVTARLVSGDGYELWSDTFDRSLQDIFAIQEEIAQAVVRALRVRLSSHEVSRLQRTGTRNSTAYEMYLRGREFYHSYWDPKQWVLARQMFKGAIELDSQFAQAYAGLADVCFFMLQWHLDDSRADTFRAEALAASEEALRLDPDLAEASLARANMLSLLERNDDAEAGFRRAIALNPALSDSYYFYARHLQAVGRLREAAEMYEETARRNPDDYQPLSLAITLWHKLKEPEKARSSARRAIEAGDRHLRLHPEDVRALYMGGTNRIYLGDRADGIERLNRAVELQPDDFATLYNVACGLSIAGEADRAIDLLERAFSTGKGFRRWLEHDPDMDPLRSLPRFQQLLARMRR